MTSEQSYKGNIIRFSAHQIHASGEFDFSPEAYSKFKYGAENIAQQFGYELADRFIKDCFSRHYSGQPLVVLPSACLHIPTASFYMTNFFVDKLNDYLFEHHLPVAKKAKIYRTVTYREDYGEMSATERFRLIKGDKFHIDRAYLGDRTLILLDDIKITGTHERIIINMLNEYRMSNPCYMLFFAELTNPQISPKIENTLNNAFVKNLNDIDYIVNHERFRFNTRAVKFILNSQPDEFDSFIAKRDGCFIQSLYYNAIGNEYYQFQAYSRNLIQLKKIIQSQ
ncbi:MAG: phosphoribosyltransferase family protein [Tannerella sp.]|jgi:hypothetical protein|nr:phosphoribosyltransferase family protein [Tannerella sp.]